MAVCPSAPPRTLGEAADALRVHERGIGRRDLLRDHDAAGVEGGEASVVPLHQLAHDAHPDLADLQCPRPQIGVIHGREVFGDRGDLGLDRGLGIDQVALDALAHAVQQARALDHLKMGLEQIAELLRRRAVQAAGLGLELAELARRFGHGHVEALVLGRDLAFGDDVLGNLNIAALADIGRPDRNAGRHGQALEDLLRSPLCGTCPPTGRLGCGRLGCGRLGCGRLGCGRLGCGRLGCGRRLVCDHRLGALLAGCRFRLAGHS